VEKLKLLEIMGCVVKKICGVNKKKKERRFPGAPEQ
jgi:hypothetical protein